MPETTTRPCRDPDCGGQAEPEQDYDTSWHECTRCGYAFGYTQSAATLTTNTEPNCAVGIPEHIRRQADHRPAPPPPLFQIRRHPHGPTAT